ncbi:MAG TPA: RsmB/NOP family class I SAM-dependent RNA methyltransferase [Caldimonas sp.]|nr:RsmB/NOP family class I SAM-dependent RNA methyltransferase [Caldimonas sp.]HEX2542693.1 RsmB/NOP family class I SAM-dependent RNA methyltransferase [Caldimonas sp.]
MPSPRRAGAPAALLDRAVELVGRVLRFAEPADAVVAAFFREHRSLGARDRQAIADTVYAVLRRLGLYRHLAASGTGTLERRLTLLGWQGSEGSRAASLVPGEADWLRACERIDPASLPEPARHNLPEWIAAPVRQSLGSEFAAWVESTEAAAPLDLRVNVLNARRDDAIERLRQEGVQAVPTPWSPLGLRVPGKPSLQRSEAFARGIVEVQDEGSQLLALLVGARRGETVVDFCAGAGGKTLAIGAQMRSTGRLYAFDVSAHRLAQIEPRLARSGLSNVHPTRIAHERDERVTRLDGKVDRVLVDAPCSGTGTLRRHPDLKWRHTPALLEELGPRQRSILAAAAQLVKAGGRLVYATCSVLEAENEAVAHDFDARFESSFERIPMLELLQRAQVEKSEALVSGSDLRLWTHRHGTDCFFAAAWRRR